MKRLLPLLVLVLAAFPAQAQSADEAAVTGLRRVHGEAVNYYPPLRIALRREPAEPLRAKPACRSAEPLYGSLALGDGADTAIALVLDEDLAAGYSHLYVDLDNDEDLTNDGSGVEWKRSANGTWGGRAVVRVSYRSPEGGVDHDVEYRLRFWRFEDRLRDVVLYTRDSYVEGTFQLGDRSWGLRLLDGNGDARFDDVAHGALVIDRDGDGKLARDSSSAEHFALDEPFELAGRGWRLESVQPDGLVARVVAVPGPPPEKAFLEPGRPALPFAAVDLDGNPVALGDFAGRLLLIDFWATWCGPCMEEMPNVVRLYRDYHGRGFEILGISLDQDLEKLRAHLARETGMAWRQVCDGKGWKAELARTYRVTGIPDTFLIGPDGRILARGLRGDSLGRALAKHLGGKPAATTPTGAEGPRPPAERDPDGTDGKRSPAERAPDAEAAYLGESHDAWLEKARALLASEQFDQALAAAYSAKLANPAYRAWLGRPPRRSSLRDFAEEGIVRAARAGLTRQAAPPPGAEAFDIPVIDSAPTIDGRMTSGEWDGALELPAGIGGSRTSLRLRSDGIHLFVACDAPEETTADGFDQFRMYLHVRLCPEIQFECVFVAREWIATNRCTGVHWQGVPGEGETERWKQHAIQEGELFGSARGASQLIGHRQYEAAVDLEEAGIHRSVPFSARFEVESDPVYVDGKFKNRLEIGGLGSEQAPVWLRVR